MTKPLTSRHGDLRGDDLHGPARELVENNTGSQLPSLICVALDGIGTTFPQVRQATPATEDVFGIVRKPIEDGECGHAYTIGFMLNVDTSSWAVGDTLYAQNDGTIDSAVTAQPVAQVVSVDATKGILYILAFSNGGGGGTPVNVWELDGNNGTDEDVNFLGTTDDQGLMFKTNDTRRGFISEDGKHAFGDLKPDLSIHKKFHAGFDGSGRLEDTNAISTDDLSYTNIYSYTVPNLATVIMTASVTGHEDGLTNRATFVKTASAYRNGVSANQEGNTQSDYVYKSAAGFGMRIVVTGDEIQVQVKGANDTVNVRWSAHIELTVIKNP